jgi:hypothetical protein
MPLLDTKRSWGLLQFDFVFAEHALAYTFVYLMQIL